MDNFYRDEQIGRLKFQTLLSLSNIQKYYFTNDKYNAVDCYVSTLKGTKVAVEIKVRSQLWNTLFMEAVKLLKMLLIIKLDLALKGIYVNFIDDKCYIFKLDLIKKLNGCYLTKEWVNSTTANYSQKKYKWMVNLPLDLAVVYEYKDGLWHNFKN